MATSNKSTGDCYFYFYSTCTKGDRCPFRHCEAALGKEIVCPQWREGRCFSPACQYRHMENRKNRSQIPCYWENQPSGCRKPHCVFMHTKPRNLAMENTPSMMFPGQSAAPEMQMGAGPMGDVGGPLHPPQSIAPLVVSFDDPESDTESTTSSPVKKPVRSRLIQDSKQFLIDINEDENKQFVVKTLEQIRLERIHKESADIYKTPIDSENIEEEMESSSGSTDLRTRLKRKRLNIDVYDEMEAFELKEIKKVALNSKPVDSGVRVKTLAEIRREKLGLKELQVESANEILNDNTEEVPSKELKLEETSDVAKENITISSLKEKPIQKRNRLRIIWDMDEFDEDSKDSGHLKDGRTSMQDAASGMEPSTRKRKLIRSTISVIRKDDQATKKQCSDVQESMKSCTNGDMPKQNENGTCDHKSENNVQDKPSATYCIPSDVNGNSSVPETPTKNSVIPDTTGVRNGMPVSFETGQDSGSAATEKVHVTPRTPSTERKLSLSAEDGLDSWNMDDEPLDENAPTGGDDLMSTLEQMINS